MSKNYYKVVIKDNKVCSHCGNELKKGTSCLVKDRKYLCSRCETLHNKLNRLSHILDTIDYMNESAYLYYQNKYDETKAELKQLKKG